MRAAGVLGAKASTLECVAPALVGGGIALLFTVYLYKSLLSNPTGRWSYGLTLYMDPGATLDDLNEAVTTLEDARRIALRVFGGAHPVTGGLGRDLCKARFTLSIRGETDGETPSLGST